MPIQTCLMIASEKLFRSVSLNQGDWKFGSKKKAITYTKIIHQYDSLANLTGL